MSEEKNLQSFVMYASFLDAAMGLNDEDFREYILSLKDYALYGMEHKSQNPMVSGLITMAQPNLEAAWERRKKAVKNGEYGILGGRPRKGETADEYKARKAKTLNNPMGFQSETLNGNVNANEIDKENEDVNVKGNWNVNGDEDDNAKGDAETMISKITNEKIEKHSIITNNISSFESSNLVEDETDHGEGTRQERPRQEVISSYSNGKKGDDSDQDKKEDNDPSDPPFETDVTPKDHQALIDDGETPPPAPPTPQKSKRQELTEFMDKCLEMAAERKEQSGELADFMPYLRQAKNAYKDLSDCDEAQAREEVSWRLHYLMEDRKKKAELAALLSKCKKHDNVK